MNITSMNTSPVIETSRLVLRPVNLKDAEQIFFLRSDREVGKYIARDLQNTSDEAKEFILKRLDDISLHKISFWAITFKDERPLVGTICLWNFTENNTVAEVGYDLMPMYQKQGIMTEAMKAVLNFGFNQLEFQRIEAFTQKKNERSKALLLKNKFVLHPNRTDEGFPENIIYVLNNQDFNASKS